jgi:hypothetical protein
VKKKVAAVLVDEFIMQQIGADAEFFDVIGSINNI